MKSLKKLTLGRSMVEMIGVLAIIGILSIGSFQAYEYAVDSHEANQIITFVNSVVTNAQNRNVEYTDVDCAANFPLIQKEYPDQVETCHLWYQKGGAVSIALTFTKDTATRVVRMVTSRQNHMLHIADNIESRGEDEPLQAGFMVGETRRSVEILQ